MSGNVHGLQIGRQCDRTDIDEFVLKTDMRINKALSVTWEQIGTDSRSLYYFRPENCPTFADVRQHQVQESLTLLRKIDSLSGKMLPYPQNRLAARKLNGSGTI